LQPAIPEGIEFSHVDTQTDFSVDSSCKNAMSIPFRAGEAPAFSPDCAVQNTGVNKAGESVKKAPSWLERMFGN